VLSAGQALWERTPVKSVMGTRVTHLQGRQPTFRDIVKRAFAHMVPFEAFTFFDSTGCHDKISRTQVVRTH
jgi:uncharacterized RDD family membrane protein YckC